MQCFKRLVGPDEAESSGQRGQTDAHLHSTSGGAPGAGDSINSNEAALPVAGIELIPGTWEFTAATVDLIITLLGFK